LPFKAIVEYKGYIGVVDFESEIVLFHGTMDNTQNVITFYSTSVTELQEEMQKSLGARASFTEKF